MWWENDETPAGEGARRDPAGSALTEEASQFPRRKASYFPAMPPLFKATDLQYLQIKCFKIR
ncbi:hypothetical protein HM131_14890 [Halobacillus mangrovi]|uniref:Uncharacterized protein n=1 Tax=Halobacillus mangrovi TaxID=402384 RepID=A0A1W5ZXL2_9BACI|nr:hypothetical protein HM131_14890 [Halobacillus mangrovi]